jgi:HK97 family phage portal protein
VSKKNIDVDDLTETYVWKTLYDNPNTQSLKNIAQSLPANIYPIASAIAEDFAKLELNLVKDKKTKGGEVETVPVDSNESLAMECLMKVNNQQTHFNLFEETGYSYALLGASLWYIPKAPRGNFREIYWLNPLNISNEVYDKWGYLVSFNYITAEGKTENYKNDYENGEIEFIYDITFNLADTRKGFSPIQPIQTIAETYKAAIDYNHKYFVNDATPTLLIKMKQKLSDTMKKMFKLDWLEQFRGKDKSHKFAITDSDMEVEPLSFSNKDMEFDKLIERASNEIMTNWRVNKIILGQTENINRATLEGADENHARRVIDPMYRRFVAMLNEKWLPLFIRKDKIVRDNIRFEYVSPITADKEKNSNIANTGTAGKPYMSINEARELNGLPRLDETYDYVPTYQESISITGTPLANIEEEQNSLKKAIEHYKYINRELAIENAKITETKEGKKAKEDMTEQQANRLAIQHLERALKYEPKFKDAVADYFVGLKERFNIEEAVTNSPKAYIDLFEKQVSWAEEIAELKTAVTSVTIAIAAEAWVDADKQVPGNIDFNLDSFNLLGFIESNLQFFTQTVINNTRKELAQIIEESLANGEGMPKIAKRIDEKFADYRGPRSTMIAQTEVNNIANALAQRRYEIAKEDGYIEEKMWLNAGDNRVRTDHIEANLQKAPIDGYFRVAGENLKYPGDQNASPENRINCRCASVPLVKKG